MNELLNVLKWLAIGVGVIFVLNNALGLWLAYRGQGRDRLEFSIKTLLTFTENGATLEIARLHRGLVLLFCRQDGQANWAELRLRVPLTDYSFPFGLEVKESLAHHGYEILAAEGSPDCIAAVRIPVEDIWAVGSAARAALAADLALDEMGYGKDARFVYKLKGKKNFRIWSRPRNS